MRNLHFIESKKPSSLGLHYDIVKTGMFDYAPDLGFNLFDRKNNFQHRPHHLYITSDEEIKTGDWCMYLGLSMAEFKVLDITDDDVLEYESRGHFKRHLCKKIILTTDPDLIKDGVQEIEENFLRWFVEKANDSGKPIDIVEVKKVYINHGKEDIFDLVCTACPSKYEIVIPNTDGWLSPMQKFRPREESKQADWKDSTKALMEAYGDKPEEFPYEEAETNLEKHLASVPEYKGERRSAFISRQETLEEASKNYSEKTASIKILVNDMQDRLVLCESAFEAGAKWQAEKSDKELEVAIHLYLTTLKEKEQMCTKEDMWESYKESNTIFGDEIALRQEFEEWFEQFKKK